MKTNGHNFKHLLQPTSSDSPSYHVTSTFQSHPQFHEETILLSPAKIFHSYASAGN